MQTNPAAASGKPTPLPPIQFYSIELTPLTDGLAVGIGATLCEDAGDAELELAHMDLPQQTPL